MGVFKQYVMRAFRAADSSYYTWVASEFDDDMSEGNPPNSPGDYSDFQVVARVGVDYLAIQLSESGGSVDWDLEDGVVAQLVLTDDWQLNDPTNIGVGKTYLLFVIQDGSGGHALTFDSAYKWPGGTAPTISTGAGAVDIISFISDGTNMYGVFSQDFS